MVPKIHVATACFSCSTPDLNSSKLPLTAEAIKLPIFSNYLPENQNSAVSVSSYWFFSL
jgi:hypothetical protein